MKIEVLRTERRWRWSLLGKLQIVEETVPPGVMVAEAARRHELAPSVVFGRLSGTGPAFMPVEITPIPVQKAPVVFLPRRTGVIEIV